MKIEMHEIPIREVTKDYIDNAENGVRGYSGRLNIRPAYQREFVYSNDKRDAVIDTVYKGFPLNVMYWCKDSDGNYELLDGQQRTISICSYVNGDYSVHSRGFYNLTKDEQEKILNYKLMIYICEGTDREKLDWFKIINIAGEKLYDQELRNAMYTGPWLYDAKKHFSKNGCAAYGIGEKYLNGTCIRQDFLETALKWISNKYNCEIEDYMSSHQQDEDSNELWMYFQSVIDWVKRLFPTYRKEMKGIEWGILYNEYKDKSFNSDYLEQRVIKLMEDEEITKRSGIYPYLITGKEKYLSLRSFPDSIKRQVYEKQEGICPMCKEHYEIEGMEADHITPWSEGGKKTLDNCQMLCKDCNRRKSNK